MKKMSPLSKNILLLSAFLFLLFQVKGQNGVAINTDGSAADSKAMLDIKSTTKGVLIPRMTTAQRTAIASPPNGLMVYDTDIKAFYYYDNSDWHKVLMGGGSTDYSDFESDGTLVNHGNATVWNDIVTPWASLKAVGQVDKPDPDNTNLGLLFPKNDTTEMVGIIVQMSHSWKEGSIVYPHVHWTQANSSNVGWRLVYKWWNIGDPEPSSWVAVDMTTQAITYTSGTIQQISHTTSGISGTGKKISSIILIKLYRKDNLSTGLVADDARLIQFDVHYEIDTEGSRNEYTK